MGVVELIEVFKIFAELEATFYFGADRLLGQSEGQRNELSFVFSYLFIIIHFPLPPLTLSL